MTPVPPVTSPIHDLWHGPTGCAASYPGAVSESRIDLIGIIAAVLTWVAVGAAAFLGVGIEGTPLWWAAYLGYAAVLVPLCLTREYPRPLLAVMLSVQLALGVIVFVLSPFGPTGVALVTTACMLAVWLPARLAVAGMVGQTLLALVAGVVHQPRTESASIVTICIVYFGFQLFAFLMVIASQRESAARQAAERAQAALHRAQAQLAARSRDEERLRISRDLHDTLGHQLTALALNLEVLAHTADEASAAQARNCRDLAKDVLTQVREVVGQLREPRPEDLAARLADLVPTLPRPRLDLQVDPQLGRLDPTAVDAVARLVQEALTNSARHSRATVLSVRVLRDADGITVEARDDGAGSDVIVPGNGLRGMAERFAALGGTAGWAGGDGFTVRAQLPAAVPVGAR